MPAKKLGQYIRSELFLKRANEAVAEAVRELQAKGIKPTYITRQREERSRATKSDSEEQE